LLEIVSTILSGDCGDCLEVVGCVNGARVEVGIVGEEVETGEEAGGMMGICPVEIAGGDVEAGVLLIIVWEDCF